MIPILEPRTGAPGFSSVIGELNSIATFGGRSMIDKSQAIASLNVETHNNQAWWNMFLIGSTPVSKPEPINGIVEFIANGKLHRFYNYQSGVNKGKTEYEIVLEEAPAGGVLEFRIRHSGLDIGQQIISPERALMGDVYGYPAAEQSLAFYIKGKRDNEFRNGKVGHVDRFWARGRDGRFYWLDMQFYNDGHNQERLIVTIPAGIIYPIVVGPTIGYTTKGGLLGTSFAGADRRVLFWWVQQAASSGTVTAFKGYFNSDTNNVKMMVAETSGSAPNYYCSGQALAAYGSGQMSSSGITTLSSVTPLKNIVSGNYYRRGWAIETDSADVWYDNLGPGTYRREYYVENTWADVIKDPLPATTNQPSTISQFSVWAEFDSVFNPYYAAAAVLDDY